MSCPRLSIDLPLSPFSSSFPDPPFTTQIDLEESWPLYTEHTSPNAVFSEKYPANLRMIQSIAIIVCITASTVISTILSGLVIVSTPEIAIDLKLGTSFQLWSVAT
jgi:hypothetical protein